MGVLLDKATREGTTYRVPKVVKTRTVASRVELP